MTQSERLDKLISWLLSEREEYRSVAVPSDTADKRRLLRALMNVRPPAPVSAEFLAAQDEYLQERLRERSVTKLDELTPVQPGLYLWQGDITTLGCDAIVNAANSGMTGCYVPCHSCIDNAIHTYAGVQLRAACAELMRRQGHEEPTGSAKITPAFNLPCRYVLHTVGPIIDGYPDERDRALLASCYRSCLELAAAHGVRSVAFCCISTGEFRFPNALAADIAIRTVREWQSEHSDGMEVIFNVFKDADLEIYRERLGRA